MKKLCIISIDRENGLLFSQNLCELFPNMFDISVFTFTESIPEPFSYDLILYTSEEIEESLSADIPRSKMLFAKMSFTKENLRKLNQSIEGGQALYISNNENSAKEMIDIIYSLGIKEVELFPYYPGISDFPRLTVGITSHNERKIVPEFITHVVDIGHRGMEPLFLLQLLAKLDLLSAKNLEIINNYAQEFISMFSGYFKLCTDAIHTQHKLKDILNNISDGIILCKADGQIGFSNQKIETIFNLSMDYIREKNVLNLFSNYQIDCTSLQDGFETTVTILGKVYFLRISENLIENEFIITLSDLNNIRYIETKSHRHLHGSHRAKYTFHNIIGTSKQITRAIERARQFAASELPILIQGESGTGKELFASAIHNCSNRNNHPFVAFNCAAMNENLIESELFGYVDGAFTGALKKGKAGLFEIANQGTVFLDEIGDMPLSLQVKLLRVLQEKEMIKVGGTEVIPVDLRIIAATNKDLRQMVEEGTFRKDLYYRICVLSLPIPNLRHRTEDLGLLISYFKDKYDTHFKFTENAREFLLKYNWSGNIRELENLVQYIQVLHLDTVDLGDLPGNMLIQENHSKNASLTPMEQALLLSLREYYPKRASRKALHLSLTEKGIDCSEMEIRKTLYRFEEAGLLTISPGRGGTILTALGIRQADDCIQK